MQTGKRAGRLKTRKEVIITLKVPTAPATIPPVTKAINAWWPIESAGNSSMAAEPQTAPARKSVTVNRKFHFSGSAYWVGELLYNDSKARRIPLEITAQVNQMRMFSFGTYPLTTSARIIPFMRVAAVPKPIC